MKLLSIRLVALITLSFCGITARGSSPTAIDPANYTAPVRVACVGDSITAGYLLQAGQAYPDQLQTILGGKWSVKNFGLSGRTLLKKGDEPYWNEPAFKDAQTFKPDVVIIQLGSNDTKPKNWIHHDEFYGDYKEMIETFKKLESKPRVFVCLPPPALSGNYDISAANLALEMPLIVQVAAAENVPIIDLNAPFVGKPQLLQADGIHPSASGAVVLAQTVATTLTGK